MSKKTIKEVKEPIYKSRRIWAAGLTLLATVVITAMPEQYVLIESATLVIASLLGLGSWVFPKK